MTATDRLDAIEARANAAPEGQWYVERDGSVWVDHSHGDRASASGLTPPLPIWADGAATFIAASRTDVPALVAALRGVLRIHAPKWTQGGHICRACGAFLDDDRPDCPTVATITAALTEVTR